MVDHRPYGDDPDVSLSVDETCFWNLSYYTGAIVHGMTVTVMPKLSVRVYGGFEYTPMWFKVGPYEFR